MKKMFRRLLCCLMAVSFALSSVLPSLAASNPIDIQFPSPPEELAAGETIDVDAIVNTTTSDKLSTYSYKWSSNSKIIEVDPSDVQSTESGTLPEFPTVTLTAVDDFEKDTLVQITLLVMDTTNGKSNSKSFSIKAIAPPPEIVDLKINTVPATNDETPQIRVGDTLKLEAVGTDSKNNKYKNLSIEWSSEKPGYATVDKGSVLGVAKSDSSFEIYADYGDFHKSIEVIVVDAFAVLIAEEDKNATSSNMTYTLGPEDELNLEVTVLPTEDNDLYDPSKLSWKTSNKDIVEITETDGWTATIKAKDNLTSKVKTATVTASFPDPKTGISKSAACTVTVTPYKLTLQEIRIKEPITSTLVIGGKETVNLEAELDYEDEDGGTHTIPASSDNVTWTSNNPKIAEVWRDGSVHAKGGGIVTITATSTDPLENGKPGTDTWKIEVKQSLRRITLSNTRKDLQIVITSDQKTKKESFDLIVSHDPETSWPQMEFDYEVDNDGIVEIEPDSDNNQKFKVTAEAVGTAVITITGTFEDDEGVTREETATCEVIVSKPITDIKLKETKCTLKKGESHKLDYILYPETEVKGTPRWSTSDNRYVRVDENGKITAVEYTDKPVKITASIGERPNPIYTDTCEVTVEETPVAGVLLTAGVKGEGENKTASVSLGSYLQLSAKVDPPESTYTDLIWSSSDEKFATVNRNGKVTPQRKTEPGEPVTIRVQSKQNEDVYDEVKVTVTAHQVTGVRMDPADPITLEKVGDTVQLVGSLVPSTADDTLRWTVSGGQINAGVISNGTLSLKYKSSSNDKVVIVTGLTPGESDVLVNVGDFTVNNKVTVSGITFEKSAISVAVGKSEPVAKKLFGTARNLNAKDWEWSSDNEMVARVNPSTGMISGIKPGTAKITCKNGIYSAEIPVTVSESSAAVLSYKMTDEKLYSFASKILSDIRNQCKTSFEGSDLNYVTNLSVPPSQGTLYYGYVSETNPGQGVAASDKFYYKTSATGSARPEDAVRYATGKPLDKLLADVTFVPATGFSGKADISYTAFAENGKDLAGSIQITVPVATELTYDSPNGEAVRFVTNDFSTLSQATTGYPISSVRFNAPSERYGYLYYEYAGGEVYGSNITSGQRFYASSTPSLDSVSFVPRAGFTGTFPLTFTGWNTNGVTFTGTIRITVKSTGEGGGDITYNTLSGSRVYFDAIDFQDLCRTATGGKLNYVQFTALPSTDKSSSSSSSAVLYHGSGSGSRVSTSSSLYASSSGSRWTLDNVYLLPSSSFTGSVTIPFKGWDTDRKTFEGTVVVNVTKDGGTAATIYMTCTGMPLVFSRADFDDAIKDALPALLKSVRFNLPGTNSGTLYSRFNDLNDRQPLAANQDIPVADLVTLSYLPKGETSGTVYLSYTATDEKDNICTGQVRITIAPNTVSQYFVDLNNTVWAIPSINFLRTYGVVTGKGKKRYQPNDTLKRGDFVLMLARAFDFSLNGTESFPDVPRDSYYAGAIAAGKALNLIKGAGSNGNFRPEDEITRQEAATILFRVLQSKQNLSTADLGYLTAFSDMGQVESYAQAALATLVRDGIFEGSGGRLYPYAPLTRAQMAVILHRAIT